MDVSGSPYKADTQLCRDVLRFLQSIDETGAAVQAAIEDTGISLPEFEAKSNSTSTTSPKGNEPEHMSAPFPTRPPHLAAPASDSLISGRSSPHSHHSSPHGILTMIDGRTPSPASSRIQAIRTESGGRVTSPFELSSPRMWTSPPSPMTVDTVPDQPTLPTPPAVPSPGEDHEG